MSWYSDREPFDEWDDPYCERIRCEGGESYEQCQRCLARVYGNTADEEEEEPYMERDCGECIHLDKVYNRTLEDGTLEIGTECDGTLGGCDRWEADS